MTGLNRRALLGVGALGAVSLTANLAGCTTPPPPAAAPSESTASEGSDMPTASASAAAPGLLVYFSRAGENYFNGGRRNLAVGNTKVLAQMIEQRIDCDSYEIVAADPYPDAYEPTVERNQREQNANARPRIAGELPDVGVYSTVLLGSPIWNVRAPMIMSTFLESVDLAGKTILPFVTYAVSGMSGVDDAYRRTIPTATVADGLAVRGEEVRDAGSQLDAWLRSHRLLRG